MMSASQFHLGTSTPLPVRQRIGSFLEEQDREWRIGQITRHTLIRTGSARRCEGPSSTLDSRPIARGSNWSLPAARGFPHGAAVPGSTEEQADALYDRPDSKDVSDTPVRQPRTAENGEVCSA